jgi:hypothetical protein
MQNKLSNVAFSTSQSTLYSAALDAVCGGNVLANNKTYASEQINMILHDLLSRTKWRSIIFILYISLRANNTHEAIFRSTDGHRRLCVLCVLQECWCVCAQPGWILNGTHKKSGRYILCAQFLQFAAQTPSQLVPHTKAR